MAWMDGYAIGLGILAEDYKNGNQYTNGVRSAYILDNSCSNRYDDPASTCRDRYVNYAFRTANIPDSSNVPEPASVTLLGIGLLGFVASRRKSTK